MSPAHLLLEELASTSALSSLTRVAAKSSSPRSRSVRSFEGMGIAAVGDSLVVSAAWVWLSREGVVGVVILEECALVGEEGLGFMERTTSPLQMGQVRRRVVSQGVLGYVVSIARQVGHRTQNLHEFCVELMSAW